MTLWLLYYTLQFLLIVNFREVEAELVICDSNYTLENGHIAFSPNKSYVNGSSERVVCSAGYRISGEAKVTCLDGGNWSNNTLCLHIECNHEYAIDNGHVSFSDNETYYGNDTVPVNCSIGYKPKGDTYITCLFNGNWSNNTSCVSSDEEKEENLNNDGAEILKTLLVVGLILVVAVISCVAVLVVFRHSRKANLQDDIEKADLTTFDMEIKVWGKFRSEAVPVTDFPSYVDELHKSNNLKFSDAFRLLTEQSPLHSTAVAETPACRPKTRFSNILPFDHSRVALVPREGVDGSDFINANYIPGYTSPDEYIATQGPVSETKNDFWRMIWEHDVQIIVMLTERIEKGKGSLPRNCSLDRHWLAQTFEPYWPDMVEGLVLYGDLIIKTTSESVMSDHISRKIIIKKEEDVKYITHLQFVGWPDRRKLKKTWPFITFVTTVRHLQAYSTGKHTVVHCSNGVGRTGLFIALDRLIQQAREERCIDVCSVILDMRNYRCNMVKTEEQLVYIFECLRHYITLESDEEDGEEGEDSQYVSLEDGQTTFDNVAFFKEDGEKQ